jgi:hypothetical protein
MSPLVQGELPPRAPGRLRMEGMGLVAPSSPAGRSRSPGCSSVRGIPPDRAPEQDGNRRVVGYRFASVCPASPDTLWVTFLPSGVR